MSKEMLTEVRDETSQKTRGIDQLLDVMRKLRDPETGCPWDIKQDFKSLARYTLEEAYEVVEAIENDDHDHLCEELGDLLLQIVFQAEIAQETALFSFDDVAAREAHKMIERHPHVFGDRAGVSTAADVLKNWEADKAAKKAAKAKDEARAHSVLDDVNTALPAVSRALKLHQRAARVGFDWGNPTDIIAKIREETDELEVEIKANTNRDALEMELGDVLSVVVTLARHLEIDPERALRRSNQKFESRFRFIEDSLRQRGQPIAEASLDEMEALWQEAKKGEL
ncbi:MAG: nucleoside triphosphate pyrophosphohydrolase [Bdellovibrionales bacterium]|jgi:MazG family protein